MGIRFSRKVDGIHRGYIGIKKGEHLKVTGMHTPSFPSDERPWDLMQPKNNFLEISSKVWGMNGGNPVSNTFKIITSTWDEANRWLTWDLEGDHVNGDKDIDEVYVTVDFVIDCERK